MAHLDRSLPCRSPFVAAQTPASQQGTIRSPALGPACSYVDYTGLWWMDGGVSEDDTMTGSTSSARHKWKWFGNKIVCGRDAGNPIRQTTLSAKASGRLFSSESSRARRKRAVQRVENHEALLQPRVVVRLR